MLSESERTELQRLIVEEMEKAQFEAILRTNLVQEPARFTQSTNYGDIVTAAIAAAIEENWMPNLLATLIYERQATGLGALATALGAAHVGPGLQGLINQVDAMYDWSVMARRATAIGRHVCLLEIDHVARGTGVLVGPDLVLTAQHVVVPLMDSGQPAPATATRLMITFDFTTTELPDGTRQLNPGIKKKVADRWLVDQSPPHPLEIANNYPPDDSPPFTQFDFALIKLAERVGEEVLVPLGSPRGWAIVEAVKPLTILQRIHISQHPAGQALMGSSGRISTLPPHHARIRYKASTSNVSSGSPCWNNDYQLIALHNFGGVTTPNGLENQGVPIACIVHELTNGAASIALPEAPLPAAGSAPPRANSAAAGATTSLSRMWTLGAEYPILNRHRLQQALASVVAESGSQLLAVRGKSHSGRTFTTKVVQQFLRPFGHLALTVPAQELMDKKPEDVLLELRSTLSLPSPSEAIGSDLTTRAAQINRHLVSGFFADVRLKYPAIPPLGAPPMQVWLLFDGLDQVHLVNETHELIAQIIQRISEVSMLRLVLIGYDRELPSEVDAIAEKETITDVTIADVADHIRYACRDKGLVMPEEKLNELAANVFAVAPAAPAKRLGAIGMAVREIVRSLGN